MTMNDELLLGIDVGTTNCKALLFDTGGLIHGAGSLPTPTRRPQPNRAEHDPAELWDAVATTIRQALAGVDPARVRGVAVASMGEAGVLLDAQGRPTHPIISWHDSRTIDQHRWWLEHAGDTFQLTGITPSSIFGVYKLMWLREHAPEAYAEARSWLHIADYIAFRLCGIRATDFSLASRTMLLDLRNRRWADSLIDLAGLRRDLLPELVTSGTRLGGVTPQAAAETGLVAGTSVGAGGHDHVCGALASGVGQAGACLDSMGTAEAIFFALGSLPNPLPAGRTFGAHVASGRYYTMNSLWGGGSVTWAAERLGWHEQGVSVYERMEAAAARAPLGSLGAMFLPNLKGDQRGALVGLTAGAGPEALGRAVYEGLAYEWRRILEAIETAIGISATMIRLIGGGARSKIWVQIKADVIGRPLSILSIEESVALGAGLLGGMAAGVYASEADAIARLQHGERTVTPDPAHVADYDRRYRDVYLKLAPALADLHAAIDSVEA